MVHSDVERPADDAAAEGDAAARKADGTVGKAIDLLDLIAELGRPARLVELQQVSDLPKSTLYRLLQTLVSQRMLTLDPSTNAYLLGPRLVRLANMAVRQTTLAPLARPHLDALSRTLGQTIHLAKLDHGHVLYLDKRNAARRLPMFAEAGKVGPAYCTGVGKAMLAFLDETSLRAALAEQSWLRHTPNTLTDAETLRAELGAVRRERLAFDREEHEPQIICVAAPILDEAGRPLGAISVTSSTMRHTLEDLEAFAPALRATAAAIARDADGRS